MRFLAGFRYIYIYYSKYGVYSAQCPVINNGISRRDYNRVSAVRSRSIKLMRILFPVRMNANYQDDRTGGYLAMAVSCGDMEFIRSLLEHGADLNIHQLASFYPAPCVAVSKGNTEIALKQQNFLSLLKQASQSISEDAWSCNPPIDFGPEHELFIACSNT